MLERQWWVDVAMQLRDAIPFAAPSQPRPRRAWQQAGSALRKHPQGRWAAEPDQAGSRCPSCGHRIRWHENIPISAG
jgi:leader peptidase (prepilin peptidase)/N-methyltransferase